MPIRHPWVVAAVLVALIVGILAGRAWAQLDSQAGVTPPSPSRGFQYFPRAGVCSGQDSRTCPEWMGGPQLEDPALLTDAALQAAEDAREAARVAAEAAAAEDDARQAAWANLVALAVRIGRCEEPGDGLYGIDWTADGWTSAGHFAGGLGIGVGLYASLSGGRYAPADPPEEQIRVFGLAWARFGQAAWGCRA